MTNKAPWRTTIWLVIAYLYTMASQATPSVSEWRHLTLLGANDDNYFLLVTERSLPGSYYNFTENWYLEKWRLIDNTRLDRKLLRTASFVNRSDNAIAKWEIDKEETPGIFDLARLLEHEKLMPPYPGSALPSNLQLKYHENKVLSLTYKDLDIPISNRVELFPADIVKPSVYKKFMAQGTTFYQVESGYPDDVGYKQVMIPISQELRKTIMDRYQAFQKSERRQSPP